MALLKRRKQRKQAAEQKARGEQNARTAQANLANFHPAAPAISPYPNLGTRVMSQPQVSAQEQTRMRNDMSTPNDIFTGSFNSAFGQARKAGLKEFTWNGKRYGTQLAQPTSTPATQSVSKQAQTRQTPVASPTPAQRSTSTNRVATAAPIAIAPVDTVPSVNTATSRASAQAAIPQYDRNSNLSSPAQSNTQQRVATSVQPVAPRQTQQVPVQTQMPIRNRQTAQVQVEAPAQNNVRGGSNSVQATTARYAANNTIGGDFGIGRGLQRIGEGVVDFFRNIPRVETGARPLGLAPGHTTRYASGGKLEDKQKEFVAYLIQASGVSDDQELNEYIQDLGQDGLQREFEKFEELMTQGTEPVPAAAKGAKLNYIKALRGQCPDGFEMQYFKKGGVMCSQCIKKAQAQKATTKAEKGTKVVQDFKSDMKKCGGKVAKKTKKKEQGGSMAIPGVIDTKKNKLSPKGKVQIKKHYFGGKL